MPDVDGGTDAGVEELGLQVDLAVGDGDDVGRDVGRHVATLGLDDGESRQRTATAGVGQLGRPLQEPAVQVEDVAGVGLTTRRPAQQQRQLAVGLGLLGQVVVDDEGVLAVLHPVLAHGATGVGGQVLEGGRLRRRRRHHHRVLEGAVLGQDGHGLGHRRALLADGDVDALHALALLVDDGVDGHGGLARLAVADDELR